ncbi:hypothetical protein SDD30_11795 [Moorella naiadis]|uniref:hypothetical protein n=1 Tax=Moorella naiadis (nom. illeg.) TaxID=3093670 RepID=UPI003D9C9855
MLGRWWRYLKSRDRSGERPGHERELEQRVTDLQLAVNKIAADLAALLKDLAGQALDIHIDKVAIDKVNLDQLIFNIDGIGVKDLSGSLSIGLNYGGRVVRLMPGGDPDAPRIQREPVRKHRPLTGDQPRINFSTGSEEGDSRGQGT